MSVYDIDPETGDFREPRHYEPPYIEDGDCGMQLDAVYGQHGEVTRYVHMDDRTPACTNRTEATARLRRLGKPVPWEPDH